MRRLQLSGDNRRVLAYVLMGAGVIAAILVIVSQFNEAKRQTCRQGLEGRQLIADIIGNSQPSAQGTIDPNLDPTIQKLIRDSQEQQKQFLADVQKQMDKPIPICESVGIESRVRIRNKLGQELVPTAPTNSSTTTTTTASNTSGQGAQGLPGAPGGIGPPGPPGSTPTTEAPTTSTTTSTTIPPSQPLLTIPCIITRTITVC